MSQRWESRSGLRPRSRSRSRSRSRVRCRSYPPRRCRFTKIDTDVQLWVTLILVQLGLLRSTTLHLGANTTRHSIYEAYCHQVGLQTQKLGSIHDVHLLVDRVVPGESQVVQPTVHPMATPTTVEAPRVSQWARAYFVTLGTSLEIRPFTTDFSGVHTNALVRERWKQFYRELLTLPIDKRCAGLLPQHIPGVNAL